MKKYLFLLVLPILLFSSCAARVVTSDPTTKIVIVKKTPKNYKVVRVKGNRYYLWNGKYHRKTRHGYTVVKL